MKNLKEKLNQPRFRWLRSYIAIVLAIVVVLVVYSLIIINQVKKDTDATNSRFASYYINSIENRLKSIQDYSFTLAMDSKVKDFHNYSNYELMNSEAVLAEAYDIVYSIRDFIQANGMVEDIMLYYPEKDHVIGKNGSLPSYVYFKSNHLSIKKQDEEYNFWVENILNNKNKGFITVSNENNENDIYYFLRITYKEDRNEETKIVVKLSNEKLSEEMRTLIQSGQYLFAALIDTDGNVFAKAPDKTEYVDEQNRLTVPQQDQNGVFYSTDSSLWKLKLITIQDYSNAYDLVRTISFILICGMIISLLVGIAISIHYANKSRRAVEKIVQRFDELNPNQNELEFIDDQIDLLLKKNQNAIEASERQAKIIAFSFLKDLLYRKTCSGKDMEQMCAMYGIEMENELFAMIVVSKEPDNPNNIDTSTVMKLMKKCESEGFSIFWTRFSTEFQADVFLCNFTAFTKSPQTSVIEFAKKIKNETGDGWRIIISNVLDSSSKINAEWHDILHKHFPEHEVSKAKLNENEGLQAVKEFSDSIDNENLTDAINLIPFLNRKFISCRNENLTKCRKYELVGKLYESVFGESKRSEIDGLLNDIDSLDWSKRLKDVLQNVDSDLNQKTDLRQVADIAHDIIDQEYSNPQLGLHLIADRIGVSQSYLSRLFKQKYGVGVIRYLNYVRIEQAKKMMITGDDNLQVIAMNVGFLSDVTLIRVFKKYENITPGSYRNKE